MAELVDARDLKSLVGDHVPVRFRLAAPAQKHPFWHESPPDGEASKPDGVFLRFRGGPAALGSAPRGTTGCGYRDDPAVVRQGSPFWHGSPPGGEASKPDGVFLRFRWAPSNGVFHCFQRGAVRPVGLGG